MLTPSQAYKDVSLQAPIVDAKVEYQLADSTEWLPLLTSQRALESGSVSISRQSSVQRTASFTVGGPDAFPDSWTHPCSPINRFRLYRGIRLSPAEPDSTEWLRVGTFVVTSQSKSRPAQLCSFELADLMQAVVDDNLPRPVETSEGIPAFSYVRRLLILTDADMPNIVDAGVEPSFPGATLRVEPGVDAGRLLTESPIFDGSRGEALDYLAQILEATLYADVDGDFVLAPKAVVLPDTDPVFALQAGDGGNYSEIKTDISFDSFCNAVSIRNGDFVVESSITEGPLRVRSGFTYRYVEDVSNQAWDEDATTRYASRVIAEKLGVAEQVSATIAVMPWLEGGDVGMIEYPDDTFAIHRIDTHTFPLGAVGSGSITTRTLHTTSIVDTPVPARDDSPGGTLDDPVVSGSDPGTETVTITAPNVNDVAILACRPDATLVEGGYAAWTLLYDGSNDTPGVSLWKGTGVGTGTTVTISGGSTTGYAVLAVVSDVTGTLDLLDVQVEAGAAPTTPAVASPAALTVGDVALCIVRAIGGYAPAAESGIVDSGFYGLHTRSVAPSGTAEGVAITTGTATDTAISATFPMTGSAGTATILSVGLKRTAAVPVYPTPPPPVEVPGGTPSGSPTDLPAGWTTELFSDYFPGSSVDLSKWRVRTDTQNNHSGRNFAKCVTVAGGVLSIRSGTDNTIDPLVKPWVTGYLDTIGKFSTRYGRWEARLRFPWGSTANGYWPAFWLRPDDGGLGEIDIMEAWPLKKSIHATIHHDYLASSDPAHLPPKGGPLMDASFDPTAWHIYAVEKEAGGILKFYVDDALVWDASHSTAWADAALDRVVNWNIRLQLQIGGSYGGNPTPATVLSQTFDADFVRVLAR